MFFTWRGFGGGFFYCDDSSLSLTKSIKPHTLIYVRRDNIFRETPHEISIAHRYPVGNFVGRWGAVSVFSAKRIFSASAHERLGNMSNTERCNVFSETSSLARAQASKEDGNYGTARCLLASAPRFSAASPSTVNRAFSLEERILPLNEARRNSSTYIWYAGRWPEYLRSSRAVQAARTWEVPELKHSHTLARSLIMLYGGC